MTSMVDETTRENCLETKKYFYFDRSRRMNTQCCERKKPGLKQEFRKVYTVFVTETKNLLNLVEVIRLSGPVKYNNFISSPCKHFGPI
jgi:hypothetical protein